MYFFDSEERVEALLAEADSWIGTPFMAYSQVKGKGVDCVRLIGTILARVGVIEPVNWKRIQKYPLDWSAHNDDPLLERTLQSMGFQFERVEGLDGLKIGDVLAFAPGKVVHHLGIYCGGNRFIHAIMRQGTQYYSTNYPPIRRFYRYAMRPLAKEDD